MSALTGDAAEPVKVFILAGQSNMEGKARLELLEYQITQPETRPLFQHLQNEDGSWVERGDVWIKFLDRKGKLTVGFGKGWNDMIHETYTAEYAENMAHFIRDVRRDLHLPELPFVIGQLGVGGDKPTRPDARRDAFKEAQAAPASLPEFKGNVTVVETDQFWDDEAQAVFDKGWRENLEVWEKVGSDYPYHYLGSVKTYSAIGKAFAEALLRR